MDIAYNLALLQERQAKRAKLKESNADAYIQQDEDMQGDNVISSSIEVQPPLRSTKCTIKPSQRDKLCARHVRPDIADSPTSWIHQVALLVT